MGEIFQQLATPDADLWLSVGLTLVYATVSAALAAGPALWLAYAMAGDPHARWPRLRRCGLAVARGAVAVPGITLGLLFVMLLSHAGPFGSLGLLYHPIALLVVQTLLALPLAVALFADALRAIPAEYADLALASGATARQLRSSLIRQAWPALLSAAGIVWLRVLGETGAAAVAGGNVAGSTRLLPTAMAMDIQHGDFGRALGLGVLLLLLGAAGAFVWQGGRRR